MDNEFPSQADVIRALQDELPLDYESDNPSHDGEGEHAVPNPDGRSQKCDQDPYHGPLTNLICP